MKKSDVESFIETYRFFLLDRSEAVSPEDLVFKNEKKVMIINVLEKILTPNERKVIEYRFGLCRFIIETQKEIGLNMGISPARVSQLEHSAIRKLRHHHRAKILKTFLK